MNPERDIFYECQSCNKRYRHLILRNAARKRKPGPHGTRSRARSTSPIKKRKVDEVINLEPIIKTFLCETCLDPFYCQVCGEAFSAESSLYKHVSFHNANNPSCCGICGKEFDRDRDCALHWRHHAKANELYMCYLCLKKFDSQTDIYKHLLQNCDHLSLRCFVCQESFESRKHVVSHMRLHKEFGVFETNGFDDETSPENLQMYNIVFPCPQCTKNFTTRIDFQEHLENSHKSHDMNPVVILTDISKTGILKHPLLNITLEDEASSENDGLEFFERKNIFSDIKSGIAKKNNGIFSQPQYMKKAEIQNHIKNYIKAPFKCDICEREFGLKCNLAKHMNRHTISEHFSCTLCSKTFTAEEFLYKPKINQREICSDLPESNLEARKRTASPSVQEHDTLKLAKMYMPEIEFREVSVHLVDVLSKRNVLELLTENVTRRKQCSTQPHENSIRLPFVKCERICTKNFNVDKHVSNYKIPPKSGVTGKLLKSEYSKSRCRSQHTSVQYYYCETCRAVFTDEDDFNSHKGDHRETCSDSSNNEFGSRKKVRIFRKQKKTATHPKKTKIYKRNLVKVNGRVDNSYQKNESGTFEERESQRGKDLKNSDLNTLLSSHCTVTLPSSSDLSENRKNLKIHECDTCGKCYGMKPHLYRHMGQHCYNPFFYCNLCRKGFTDVDRFLLHKTTHRGNLISRELNLNINRDSITLNNQDNTANDTGMQIMPVDYRRNVGKSKRRPLKCDACDGGFGTVPKLFKHVEKHNSSAFFYCNICKRGFLNPAKFCDHAPSHKKRLYDTEQNHAINEQSLAVSNQDNTATQTRTLNIPENHVSSTDSKRIHECNTCGRCFVLKSHLFRHMPQHNCGPYTYCRYCKKGFTDANIFHNHETSHMKGLIDLEQNLIAKKSSNQVCNQDNNEPDTRTSNISLDDGMNTSSDKSMGSRDTRTSNISVDDKMNTSPDKFMKSRGQHVLETNYEHTETGIKVHTQGDTEVESEEEGQDEERDASVIKSVVKRYICKYCNKKFTHSWNYRSHILLDHASMHTYLKSSSHDKIPVTITIIDDMYESRNSFSKESSLLSEETTQNSDEHIPITTPRKQSLKRMHSTNVEAELNLQMFRNLLSGKRPVVVLEDMYVEKTTNTGEKKSACRKRAMSEYIERVEANLAEGVPQSSLCEVYKVISDSQLNIPLESDSLTLPHLRHPSPSKEIPSIAQLEEKILSMCENTVVDNWMKEDV